MDFPVSSYSYKLAIISFQKELCSHIYPSCLSDFKIRQQMAARMEIEISRSIVMRHGMICHTPAK